MALSVRELVDLTASVLDDMTVPDFPARTVLPLLAERIDAPGAVFQRTDMRTGETEIVAHGYEAADVALMVAATSALRFEHPLLVAHAGGDLEPATAQEAAGGFLAWRGSPARSFLGSLHGRDQMVGLGIRGGTEHVVGIAFTRARRDFDDADRALLAAVQPFVQAVERHVERMCAWRCGVADPDAARAGAADLGLTPRELSVLLLLAEGLTAEGVARRLGCSPHTVHKHLGRLYEKLGVRDRLRAVLAAQRLGLLPDVAAVRAGAGSAPRSPRP